MLIACVVGMSQLSFAEVDEENVRSGQQEVNVQKHETRSYDNKIQQEKSPAASKSDQKREEKPVPIGNPIYQPPLRGAPVGRIAGGTRGIQDEVDLLLCVLTPDHTGLTTQDQPSLYFFLGGLSRYPIELTVIEALLN
jgi:hypothetical protein